MKKSEIFYLAQVSVLTDNLLKVNDVLEILRELMSQEDLAKYVEEKENTNEAI